MMIILYNSHLTTSRYLLSLWKAKSSLASLNSKNNSPVMLFRAIVMHWICFLSSVVIRMDMDWNLKTVWPTFSSFTNREWESLSLGFTVTPVKITKKVEVLPDEICLISVTFFLTRRNIFCVWENWPKTAISSWHYPFNSNWFLFIFASYFFLLNGYRNLIWVSYCRLFCLNHLLHYFDHFVCQLMHNAVGNNDSMFSSAALSTAVTNECKSKYCPPERRLILFLKRSDGSSPQANSHLSLVSPSVIDSLSSEFQSSVSLRSQLRPQRILWRPYNPLHVDYAYG